MRLPSMKVCVKLGIAFCMGFLLFLINFESCTNGTINGKLPIQTRHHQGHTATAEIYDLHRKEDCLASFSELEEKYKTQISALKHQITDLKAELMKQAHKVQEINEPHNQKLATELDHKKIEENAEERILSDHLKVQMAKVNVNRALKDEYEVSPYSSLTTKLVYSVSGGLSHRPSERPKADRKEDLVEAVYFAINSLNSMSKSKKDFSVDNFVDGIFRNDRMVGTYYNLIFRDHSNGNYHSTQVLRPFAPLQKVKVKIMDTSRVMIYLIVPLSGRVDNFRMFVERLRVILEGGEKNIFMTIVYFGIEGLAEVKDILNRFTEATQFDNYQIVTAKGEFSRGVGLQEGVNNWEGGDVLMFFCDVDIAFTPEFLEHCRYHTLPGKSVYYPIVFSLYNPNVVYANHEYIPPLDQQYHIRKESGFWRDFGFGMTCQYKSDFRRIKGFDLDIKGWGGEDVHLYRRYLQSSLKVIRVPDPGIFHIYHPKKCNTDLTAEQYRMCIYSKALNEASHIQLGMLAFKDSINQTMVQQAYAKLHESDKQKN
ncbi:chondroitin sulfate N-acetylgalactosaminyltransferase 1-like [Antedon mediterranea]|uniref:chondroitin sulfate N-acetylgalactosaminyltransferase 1-like n=1 Tax=Antedon mediterranea TaxID=105859 RepID=UPI003AF4D9BF